MLKFCIAAVLILFIVHCAPINELIINDFTKLKDLGIAKEQITEIDTLNVSEGKLFRILYRTEKK